MNRARSSVAVVAVALVGLGVTVSPAHAETSTPCTPGVWTQQTANVLPAMGTGTLYADTIASSTLAWAVGVYFNSSTQASGDVIERWTGGSNWSVVGSGDPNTSLFDVTSFGPSSAFAVGVGGSTSDHPLVTQWNGSNWHRTLLHKVHSDDTLYSVSGSSSSNVWAAGDYFIGSTNYILLEHFNGSTWAQVSIPASLDPEADAVGVLALSPTDVWVIGATKGNDNEWHLKNGVWTEGTAPVFGSLAGTSDTNIYGIHVFTSLEHWNGSTWAQVGATLTNDGMNDLTLGSAGVWSVGESNTTSRIAIAKNGVLVTTPHVSGGLNGIATGSGIALAIGGGPSQPFGFESCD
jgi:hypothetical protein